MDWRRSRFTRHHNLLTGAVPITGPIVDNGRTAGKKVGRKVAGGLNVVLQMQPAGADGSTAFSDQSKYLRTLTAEGNAQVDTAVTQFGNPTALFDGTGDFISSASSVDFDFGAGDFTIEAWVRFNALNFFNGIFSRSNSSNTLRSFEFYVENGSLRFRYRDPSNNELLTTGSGSGFVANTMYHVAATREGNTFRVFSDGQVRGSATHTAAIRDGTQPQLIGGFVASTGALNGHIGAIRVVKGTALYTANFTPPTGPFPLP